MLENIILINLFLVSNALITVAFVFYGWLYLYLYLKRKKKYALPIAIGGFVLAFSYVMTVFFELTEAGVARHYLFVLLQFLGLLMVASGYMQDAVRVKTKSSKLKLIAYPFLFPLALLVNFVLSAFISTKILHRIRYGNSKKYYPLFFFWIVYSLILLISFFSMFGFPEFPFLEMTLTRFSFSWVVLQILFLLCFVLMFRWLILYLTAKNFAKLFFYVWSFSVILCVLIAFVFVTTNLRVYEKDVMRMLATDSEPISLQVEKIRESSVDTLEKLLFDKEFIQGVKDIEIFCLDEKLEPVVLEQPYIEKIVVLDPSGYVIYDSEVPYSTGDLYPSNLMLENSLNGEISGDGYFVAYSGMKMETLGYQTVLPLFEENEFLGIVIAETTIDKEILSHSNNSVDWGFVLIDLDGKMRYSDFETGVFFDNNRKIDRLRHLDDEGSIFVQIDNERYLGSIVSVGMENSLLVVTPCDEVTFIAEESMYLLTFYVMKSTILVAVPSYYLSRKIQKECF